MQIECEDLFVAGGGGGGQTNKNALNEIHFRRQWEKRGELQWKCKSSLGNGTNESEGVL